MDSKVLVPHTRDNVMAELSSLFYLSDEGNTEKERMLEVKFAIKTRMYFFCLFHFADRTRGEALGN